MRNPLVNQEFGIDRLPFAPRAPRPAPQTRGRDQFEVDAVITGANGFIGRRLAERLTQLGQRLRLIVRRPDTVPEFAQRPNVEVVTSTITDAESLSAALAGARVIYHLAAKTSAITREEMIHTNVEGTRAVARACAAQNTAPTLIYVSSIAAAGPIARDAVRRESDVPAPISNYGRSKYAGELAAAEFAADLPLTIVRPGIVYGPGNHEMLPIFQTIQRLGLHPVVGWQTPRLSLIHVDDLVELLLRAADRGTRLTADPSDSVARLTAGQGVYFASGREFPTYAELAKIIGPLVGRPHAIPLHLFGVIPWLAARVNESVNAWRGKSDSFNTDKIVEATAPCWACSGELAERELGVSLSRSLAAGLAETAAWYREQGWIK